MTLLPRAPRVKLADVAVDEKTISLSVARAPAYRPHVPGLS